MKNDDFMDLFPMLETSPVPPVSQQVAPQPSLEKRKVPLVQSTKRPSQRPVPQQTMETSQSTQSAAFVMDDATRKALAEADQRIAEFQDEKMKKTLVATAFSTTLSATVRRTYLEDESLLTLGQNIQENISPNRIFWLRLKGVGLSESFSIRQASVALEGLLTAFHLPGQSRILFLVSGRKEDRLVTIHLGLQSLYGADFRYHSNEDLLALRSVLNGYAKANWPGLKLEAEEHVSFGFPLEEVNVSSRHKQPGVRVLTGIPSGKNQEELAATIDKLSDALLGHEWRYLVIAEPIPTHEVEGITQVCYDYAGRAESLKSFQVGESLSTNVSLTQSETHGQSKTETQRDISKGRLLGALGIAALGMVAPGLLPVAMSTVLNTMNISEGGGVGATPVMMLSTLLSGGLLAGAKTTSTVTEFPKTLSRAIAESKGANFSETIVNKYAEAAGELLDENIKRFKLCEAIGAWNVGTYFVGEDETTAEIGANVLKSLLSGDHSHLEPIRILNPQLKRHNSMVCHPLVALNQFENPNLLPMANTVMIQHPFGNHFNQLRSVIHTRELTRLINFPLSNIPGVSVRRIAADMGLRTSQITDAKAQIVLGNQIYRGDELIHYPYTFDTNLLAKHALVCGINGSGKTNTIVGVLSDLLQQAVPFLVIEPAKQEYVDWAMKCNAKLLKKYKQNEAKAQADPAWIHVYIPGRERWKGTKLSELTLNPFDFVWLNADAKPRILDHIDMIKTIINAALPMQESLPILMESLIFAIYATPCSNKASWLPGSQPPGFPKYELPTFEDGKTLTVPTFVQMATKIDDVLERCAYAKDVKMNLRAALKARVESFKRGWRLQLLNKAAPRKTAEEWNALFNRPTVINLTSLTSDDDKAFFMAVILMFIYEYRQELSEMDIEKRAKMVPGLPTGALKNLLVIEEAHRLLGYVEGTVAAFAAMPKQKVSEMFSTIISEVRAYGQGILVADQIPSRLNEDAVKNTNLKIVHKLVAADDRHAMSTALNLWENQERTISDLKVGEALVRCDMDDEAYMVKVRKNVES